MRTSRLGTLAMLATALATTGCTRGATAGGDLPRTALGRHEIRTLPLDPALRPLSATYTPSGKVLLSYQPQEETDERRVTLAVVDDDGRAMRTIFSGRIPDREKDNGIRYMVFPDNRRVFLGDFILECAPSLDRCDEHSLLPVTYPDQVAGGSHVAHRWSEMIIAPDNRHVAWTTLLSNYSAVMLMGALERNATGYIIARPRIISTLTPFLPDPAHPDGVLPQTLRNGEVKQFVAGGSGLSLAGAVERDIPDSVVQHLATGQMEAITHNPGYDETTIFSPDERLGMTMTTRFSPATDMAILGLVPRPYPASLNMGLNMFAYTYAVTGVRMSREGNVGPALIDIAASKSQPAYRGLNLSTQADWVFHSPMSWHPGGRKALWMEGRRGTADRRVQIVDLPDYRPGPTVAARPTPDAIAHGASDLSVIPGLARKATDIDVKVYGRTSGHILYRRTAGRIDKRYVDFSDDGRTTYSGQETTVLNPGGHSTYLADLRVTGSHQGMMALTITFGPLRSDRPARLIFDPNAASVPQTRGFVEYDGQRLDISELLP